MTPKTFPSLSEIPFSPGEHTDREVLLSIALAGLLRQPLPQLAHALLRALQVLLAQNGCLVVPRLNDADFDPEVVELTPGKEELDSVWDSTMTKDHQGKSPLTPLEELISRDQELGGVPPTPAPGPALLSFK